MEHDFYSFGCCRSVSKYNEYSSLPYSHSQPRGALPRDYTTQTQTPLLYTSTNTVVDFNTPPSETVKNTSDDILNI